VTRQRCADSSLVCTSAVQHQLPMCATFGRPCMLQQGPVFQPDRQLHLSSVKMLWHVSCSFTHSGRAEYVVQVGLPVPLLRRRIVFWVTTGVLLELRGSTANRGSTPGGTTAEVRYRRATSLDSSLDGATLTDEGAQVRVMRHIGCRLQEVCRSDRSAFEHRSAEPSCCRVARMLSTCVLAAG
jgi:hypothetical protein